MPDKNHARNAATRDTYKKATAGTGQDKRKRRTPVLIAGSVLAVAAIGFGVWWFALRQPPATNALPIVDEDNLASIESQLEEKVQKGMFETHMTTMWTFPDGTSPSIDAVMGNAPSNNYPYWFTVTLPGGEQVYSSSLLPVGTVLEEIVLDVDLDAGTYPAVIAVHLVDENGEELDGNMASFNISLVVLA